MVMCVDVSELATDYMERSLPWRTHLAVVWHLCQCRPCRTYLDQLHKTLRLVRYRPEPPADAET